LPFKATMKIQNNLRKGRHIFTSFPAIYQWEHIDPSGGRIGALEGQLANSHDEERKSLPL
jgi:hypothetical protein